MDPHHSNYPFFKEYLMRRTKIFAMTALCCVPLMLACGDSEEENNEPTTGFTGGSFTVTVQSVNDGCFDGAMTSIILPDGTPNDLPAPVSFPSSSALPTQVDIQFNAPFQSVQGIPFEAVGDNGLRTVAPGFPQTGVDIGADGEDCLADMTVTAELSATDANTFTGTATLTITSAVGDDCPSFLAGPPCAVTTVLRATRNN
jgi:hypothetical protein